MDSYYEQRASVPFFREMEHSERTLNFNERIETLDSTLPENNEFNFLASCHNELIRNFES